MSLIDAPRCSSPTLSAEHQQSYLLSLFESTSLQTTVTLLYKPTLQASLNAYTTASGFNYKR